LETVGMAKHKVHTPGELSGGEQQRIALARSLVTNPWIIMADEPTGNLDSKSADDVMRLLIKLSRKSKRTVVLITHNPEYLVYADRVFYLKDGRVEKTEVNSDAKTEIVKEGSLEKTQKVAAGAKEEATVEIEEEEEEEEEKTEDSDEIQ